MWFAVVALAAVAAAESQCDCGVGELYNPVTRQCVFVAGDLPADWTGPQFLFDYFAYQECSGLAAWDTHLTGQHGYEPVRVDDQCSCIASNAIDENTDVNTASGYSWDYAANTCRNALLKREDTPTSNVVDSKECAYKLVNNFPNAFSHCGSRNMCFCAQSFEYVAQAVADNPDHNATGNALNVEGASYRQCGWSFTQNLCVAQATQYSGSKLFINTQRQKANAVCDLLGYNKAQGARVVDVPTETYVPPPYVSPTIAICAVLNATKCTCNEDPRCFMNADLECVPNMVADAEVNRSSTNVTEELVSGLCGDTYCGTLTTPCDCYETPHSTGGLCGWNKAKLTCYADTVSQINDMYEAHCCDAFKTPCECKVGRLPWSGYADFNNTCGWDHDLNACRLSAITTASEMVGNGCAQAGDCLLVDLQADCNLTDCSWLDQRHTCVPQI